MSLELIVYNKKGKVLSFPGKSLKDVPADLVGCPAMEYKYHGGYYDEHCNDCHGWEIKANGQSWGLVDPRGERRQSGNTERTFKILSEFRDWTQYDEVMSREELDGLKESIREAKGRNASLWEEVRSLNDKYSNLFELLKEVYDLNEKGGPGSRKSVRTLLEGQGIVPCTECKKAICKCESE